MSRTDPPRTRTIRHDVRGKNFTVRVRSLDPDEVRYFSQARRPAQGGPGRSCDAHPGERDR
jgi:hypothetical protein